MKFRLLNTLILLMACGLAQAETTGRIFVTNEKGNSVSVIDGNTLEVETTINVGERPRGIGFAPDGKELYVAASEDNEIVVVDPVSLDILRSFKSGSDPETFAVHPNGNIYISNEDYATASVFDPKTGNKLVEVRVGLEPEGVAISPHGEYVIVTSESMNMLHVIKVPENTIEKNILVGARPRAATFSSAGNIAYATTEIGGEVVKVDIKSGKILKRSTSGSDSKFKPKDILLNKDETVLYVAGGRANVVVVMDADTLKIIKKIPVGKRVWGLGMTKDGQRIFTTNGVSGTVSVIDTNKNEVIKTIKVGKFPWGVAIHD